MRWFLRVALVGLVVGLALPVATAQATTTVEKFPFNVTLTECGETITLSGTLLGVVTVQDLGDDGLLLTFHAQPQGVSGTSSSGVPYHATGLTRATTVFVPSGGLTETFVNRFHIVGTMGAPTFYVKTTFHITVTPSGDVAVEFEKFSEECV
jgi:hypothetical protein